MDKVLTIPDDKVKDLKKEAVEKEISFKQYLQELLIDAIDNRKKKQSKK